MTNISSNITCIIEEMDLTKLSKTELLSKCEEHGIKKYKSKNKSQLINLINIEIQSKKKVESIMEYDETEKLQSSSSKNDDNQQININYSNLSINLTKNIISKEKKKFGIYFTPPNTIIKNIKILEPYISNIKNVLEPSCGSCEYVLMLNQQYDLNIVGIEHHKDIYENIKHIQTNNHNIKLYNENYLDYLTDETYDLIIGNPPYFVMSKEDVDEKYYSYFDGRPNIFILFIIKSIQLLNDEGILSFVLPKNFLNCLYYDKTRKYIYENLKIIDIIECNDDYLETSQETIIMIIQKNKDILNNKTFTLNKNNYTIFGLPKNIHKLNKLYKDSKTLNQLGFKVNVGNVVWNQCIDELTNNATKTLLIYSSDIKNNNLKIQTYKNESKKNYINREGETTPLLVINRGYGVGKYNFTYCLINIEKEYCIENHLICVRYINNITNNNLCLLYEKIIMSFEKKQTEEFIKLYFGNNAINTTELCEILPIYDI
jgi:adenine-specific DNA-methyltransferase